ncbi:MAG: CpsD/CapB family tyrosine-protein kinase [Oscillospiraceae bacterium]|nr:CpsD/CapB family tyrosine-protein kinase [Oscillospiraceae bacterium]
MKFTLFKKKSQVQDQNSFMNTRRQILNKNSSFAVQEAYKTLRTNVRFFLRGEGCKKLCVTSGAAGEGKSITLVNLAISIAEAGDKVLLIDADLRRPALARLLVEKATPGLSEVLAGMEDWDESIRKNMYPNLDILFSGETPPNPSELLGSERMQKLIDTMSQRYDYILVDTPPVNVVSDACIVANLLDGVLMLVRKDRSRKDDIKRAVDSLRLTGAKPLGFVLNGVALEHGRSYGYYN